MSTSDQNNAEDFAASLGERLPADENSVGQTGSFPDVTMLTRMANEFFRGQPAPALSSVPDASYAGSAFETRLPQLGMPLPSVPSIPSAGAPAMPGMSSALPELSSVSPGQVTAVALPAAAPVHQGLPQYDPRSASAALPSSPFSVPMPEFDEALFPSFAAGVPALPPFPPLRTEDDAKSALSAASPFYFLEHAGGLSGASMAPTTELLSQPAASPSMPNGMAQQDPQNAAGVSPFSLPMPEFDHSLFPSFVAGVPTLAPLSPLLNEDDARAARTESSSLYFLEDSGLLTASGKTQKNASVLEPKSAMAQPTAVGDLKLPRQQFDIGSVRRDFPILNERVNGHPLIWLDNAATTQKPQSVIDRHGVFLRTRKLEYSSCRPRPGGPRDRCLRGCSHQGRAFPQCFFFERDRFRSRRDRGHQPGRSVMGSASHQQGR